MYAHADGVVQAAFRAARRLYGGRQFTRRSSAMGRVWCARFVLKLEVAVHLTPREFDKLLIYTMAEVALKRKANGLKLNHPEAVAVISASALDGARAGKNLEDVMSESRTVLSRGDVMDGVADMIPYVQLEAVFTDGSRLVGPTARPADAVLGRASSVSAMRVSDHHVGLCPAG
jgi:urease subunit gamma